MKILINFFIIFSYYFIYLLYPIKPIPRVFHRLRHQLRNFQIRWEHKTSRNKMRNFIHVQKKMFLFFTSGKVPFENTINKQVLPQAPSPTITSFLLISAIFFK